MPKLLADTVLYPVVKPEYKIIRTGRTHWDFHSGGCVPELITVVEWKQVGAAATIEHAKQQGFIAPVLDLDYYSTDGGKSFEPNYI